MAKVEPSQVQNRFLSEQDMQFMGFDQLFIDDYLARLEDTNTVIEALNLSSDDIDQAQGSIDNIDTTLAEANGPLVGEDDAATNSTRGVMYRGELVNDAPLPPPITPPAPTGAPVSYSQSYTQSLADDIVTNADNIAVLKTAIDDLVGVVNTLLENMRTAGQIDE